MKNRNSLQQEIVKGLSELQSLLSRCSTISVAGCCFNYFINPSNSINSEERLTSPAKQIPFLLAILLSGEEPNNPIELDEARWKKVKPILNRLFYSYMLLYIPSEEELSEVNSEWNRVREISMLAFLHFFNTGLQASVPQMIERIKIYLVPFDKELAVMLGINASQLIEICKWISNKLQDWADRLQVAFHEEYELRIHLLDKAKIEDWSLDTLRKSTQESAYPEKAKRLLSLIDGLGVITLPELENAFPDVASVFWRQFTIQRGEGPEIIYPNEQSVFELKPLIRFNGTESLCPIANALYNAVSLVGERALLQSPDHDKFIRSRDKSLEVDSVTKLRLLLNTDANIWTSVYEKPDSQFEHDVIAIDDNLCIILESKATPPVEPFRDPDKAFIRLRDAFQADTGLQKAFKQTNNIVRRLRSGEIVTLFDSDGREVGRLLPDTSKLVIGICVTRDNYGPLATNLSLLLEKESNDPYPWAVNITDLSTIAESWASFRWSSKELRKYLEQRIMLHGKVFSDDELDFVGYFIKHGNFDFVINTQADLIQLNPDYSSIFDDIYRHLYLNGPPVILKTKKDPVLMDYRRSFESGKPVFVGEEAKLLPGKKIGRNKPCPCGSGKKYKRCCGSKQ